ncbi:MAG TPA: hypothetical protein VL309_11240 [Vicinamibacterales bacterium]|jgi:tetratricopeptide (TPR) repeat protein|nr:hypothetical protein [Vicinamibacterales bacterium]
MRWRGLASCGLAAVVAAAACTPHPKPAAPQGPPPQARLAAANDLLAEGCLDCFLEAFAAFDALRAVPAVSAIATEGAIRAALLAAVRERELGLLDAPSLARARDLVNAAPAFEPGYGPYFDVIESLPARWTPNGAAVTDDAALAAVQRAYKNRDAWLALLGGRAADDPLSAYLWLAFNCAAPTGGIKPGDVPRWLAATGDRAGTPLLKFKASTCGSYDGAALTAIERAEPRFVEIDYFLAFTATRAGKLDEAAALLQKAYAWRPRWPAVTLQMASVYLTAEEFEASHDFYARTLAMVPAFPDALLGDVKALTYAGRQEEAIAVADRLLALERWYVGDARYWRALNETQLARYDAAWSDIELANTLLLNAQVPKLAGIIAYRRHEVDVSRQKFELSRTRNPNDCETGFYLQLVDAEQARWPETAGIAAAAAACFDDEEEGLTQQIADLRARPMDEQKRQRQIAKREKRIADNARMRVTSWYNAAVANYNLRHATEARQFAERVTGDEEFGERARDLLSRIR